MAASPTDKAMLNAITAIVGDDTMSATVRRLIQQQARRLGLAQTMPEPQARFA